MKSFTTTQDMTQYEVSQDYCEPYLGATHDNLQAARFNKYDTHVDKNEFFVYDDVNHKYNIYHRVEYIENTSTAYIDPQYITNANSIIEIKVQLTATAVQNRIIGNTSGYFECYINGSSKLGFTSNGSLYVSNITANTELHTFKIDNNALKGYIDVTQINITKNAASYYNNAYLISRNGSNTCKCKIYYSKIYNGNILVRDFISVKNTLTNQYGLLDTVEQKFYVSPNGVEFNGGNEIIEDKNGVQYYVKNYVDVSGTKYISTGIAPDAQDSWEAKYYFNSGRNYAWGSWSSVGTTFNNAYGINASGNTIYFNYADTQTSYNVSYDNKIFVLKANKNIFYVNGNIIGQVTETTGETASRNFLIGNYNGSSYAGSGKIYYFKYWQHDELVRDYIPVQRISDSVYGLYDKVNGTFKISAGSAQFTGG